MCQLSNCTRLQVRVVHLFWAWIIMYFTKKMKIGVGLQSWAPDPRINSLMSKLCVLCKSDDYFLPPFLPGQNNL